MIWNIIGRYFAELFNLLNEMAPYLLLGFVFAGILYRYFPQERVRKFMGKNNFRSVFNAALIGIPLPLCSCGVIPTGISFFKNGASRGSSVSFLISTPQTGVDSIMATYSLLGLPLAIIRPVIALFTGLAGGLATNLGIREGHDNAAEDDTASPGSAWQRPSMNATMKYAFVDFLQDISKWLVIGLMIAALISVLVPDDFFVEYVGNEYLSMLIVLVASIPLYVCATGSVPIAAVLLMKGLSPGAAIVFLMAGPATNAATITVIGKVMGSKTLYTYLISIIVGAVLFGLVVNEWLPREWFTDYIVQHGSRHVHLLPEWLKIASGILLVALIINGYIQRYRPAGEKAKIQQSKRNTYTNGMKKETITVNGMTCNHCVANVEKNLSAIEGIKKIDIDLAKSKVQIEGDYIDLDRVREKVEEIGYEYAGKAS